MGAAQYPYVRAARNAVEAYQLGQLQPFRLNQGVWAFSAGPIRAIVLDTRSRRSKTEILCSAQMSALESWLAAPEATGQLNVIATGSVLLPNKIPHGTPHNPGRNDSFQRYPEDARKMREAINNAHENDESFRFLALSGDYHLSSAAIITKDNVPIGACIVAPSLFSPLPFIDSNPHTIWADQEISLNAGPSWKLRPATGDSVGQRGNGLGIINVNRKQVNGNTSYLLSFSATVWMPYQQNIDSDQLDFRWELVL
jgi:hypothetical protein